ILFIDAVNEVARERAQSFLTDDHIERIIGAYRAFRTEDGFATVATLDDIKKNLWSLNIPLYVQTRTTKALTQPNGSGTNSKILSGWLDSATKAREALGGILPKFNPADAL